LTRVQSTSCISDEVLILKWLKVLLDSLKFKIEAGLLVWSRYSLVIRVIFLWQNWQMFKHWRVLVQLWSRTHHWVWDFCILCWMVL